MPRISLVRREQRGTGFAVADPPAQRGRPRTPDELKP